MMKSRSIAFSAVALLTALTACDPATPSATSAEFAQADSDHNGSLSADEYKRLIAIRAAGGDAVAAQSVKANMKYDTYGTRFKNLDRNGDGVLSSAELGLK